MISARYAVVWVNWDTKKVIVEDVEHRKLWLDPIGAAEDEFWGDPIGASHRQWRNMTTKDRQMLMLETIVELVTRGFDISEVLREFIKITEFKALGKESMPMCRALTMAVLGRSLEPNTMSFEELLTHCPTQQEGIPT
jgi:hypothetical protein